MGAVDGTVASPRLLTRIRRGDLGGVIISDDNFTSLAGLRTLIRTLQTAAASGGNPPLLIATDQEGGTVKRLPYGPPSQSAAAMGMDDNAASVNRIGAGTGRYLRAYGINIDLAPVLDVGDASSSFLGTRILSANPATVATLGTAFVTGLQTNHVASTAKHFPGLGAAPGDTDNEIVKVSSTLAELYERLVSFQAAIKGGVKVVMVSNAEYPALDPTDLPASLSPTVVTTLLRQRLGFKGVVITDTMDAPAILQFPDAPIKAIKAGDDILLYSDDQQASLKPFTLLYQAVTLHVLSLAAVREAYGRIMTLKSWLYPSH